MTEVLKQVERRLSQQGRVPVINRSNILAVFLGTSISQALAADDSMDNRLSSFQKEYLEVN